MATRASLTASRPIEATEGVLEVPPLPVTPPVTLFGSNIKVAPPL